MEKEIVVSSAYIVAWQCFKEGVFHIAKLEFHPTYHVLAREGLGSPPPKKELS